MSKIKLGFKDKSEYIYIHMQEWSAAWIPNSVELDA
jgi:hypothetical protein